jgi:hypothetical protein
MSITIDPGIVPRIVGLSGGHPHILQLLGSHLIEHENEDPDGTIDSTDLVNSLKRICYEDRARVYDSTLHTLELHNKLDALQALLGVASNTFPTRIEREAAIEAVSSEPIQWLVDHNILSIPSPDHYGLVDEFLRIRLVLDGAESDEGRSELERRMIRSRGIGSHFLGEDYSLDDTEEFIDDV